MNLKELGLWTLSIVQCFLKNTTYRKLNMFPSLGKNKVAPTLLGPLQRGSLSHWKGKLIYFPKRRVFEKPLDDGQSPKT
jgi:hypothetical protein